MFNDEARMTFTEHLGELRTRIIRSSVAFVAGVVLCYAFCNQIFNILAKPLTGAGIDWVTQNPLEPLLVQLKLSAYAGGVVAAPFIVYQICAFIFPGLTQREKKMTKVLLVGCSGLAIAGVLVAYFGIFPFILPFLLQWTPPGVINQMRMNETVFLIVQILAAFAIAFQFPMAVMVLVSLDLLSPDTLSKHRRPIIIGLAVLASVLTPPDPFSILVLFFPLLILFEGSILIGRLIVRARKRAVPKQEPKS